MELFWKAAAGTVVAVILMLTLRRQEMAVLLGLAVCAMVGLTAVEYLGPVMELLESLGQWGGLDGELMQTLLKAAGIGVVTEIAGLVCADSGSSSLGKTLQLLGTAAMLWLSVPLFTALLELIREILGEL